MRKTSYKKTAMRFIAGATALGLCLGTFPGTGTIATTLNTSATSGDASTVASSDATEATSMTFGTKEMALEQGTYYVPVALKNASNINNASMAADCVGTYGVLEVGEDQTATMMITLQTLSAFTLYGNATSMAVYSEYNVTSETTDVEVLTTRNAQYGMQSAPSTAEVPETVQFTLPYTNQNGVYITMYVDAMQMNVDAYLAMDYDNVVSMAAVDNNIALGEAAKETSYKAEDYEAITTATTNAKAAVETGEITEIVNANTQLEAALAVDKYLTIEDGTYTLDATILNATKDEISHANGVLAGTTAIVEDGKITLQIALKALAAYGQTAWMSGLQYEVNGEYVDASVLSKDAEDHVTAVEMELEDNREIINVKTVTSGHSSNARMNLNFDSIAVKVITEDASGDANGSGDATTEAPTTEAPTNQEPTTEAPTNQAPTTETPANQAPTTEAPAATTQNPTTTTTQAASSAKKVLKVSKSSLSMKKGKKKAITVKYNGKTIKFKSYKWTSTNKKIAVVKNGKIVGKKKGSATITIKYQGVSKKIKVKVK